MLFLNNSLKKIIATFSVATVLFANNSSFVNMKNYENDIKTIKKLAVANNDDYQAMIYYYSHSNDPKNWFALGAIYLTGINIPDKSGKIIKPDIKKAEYWLIKATKNKFYPAGIMLASFYMYNEKYSTPEDLRKAEKILKYLVNNGYYDAITYLADCYKLQEKYDKFVDTLQVGDQYNNANAQLALALLYYYGLEDDSKSGKNKIIINRNYDVANYYLTKACTNPKKSKAVANFCNPKYNKNIIYQKKQNGNNKNK